MGEALALTVVQRHAKRLTAPGTPSHHRSGSQPLILHMARSNFLFLTGITTTGLWFRAGFLTVVFILSLSSRFLELVNGLTESRLFVIPLPSRHSRIKHRSDVCQNSIGRNID